MSLKVECTWGMGPDIILDFKDHVFVLYEDIIENSFKYGYVKNGSTDLTLQEAKLLVNSLNNSIEELERIEKSLIEYEAEQRLKDKGE